MTISIAVHSTLESMQNEHGLRHDDYEQYREYCSRRLSRLRHNSAVRKDMVQSPSYAVGEAKKKRNAYTKRDLPEAEAITHENFILVALVEAERAWAHSRELKALILELIPPHHNKVKATEASIRQHALRRLRRAKHFALRFVDLTQSFCDDHTQLEAKLYLAWIVGNLALERSAFQGACDEFKRAVDICESLAESHDDIEMRDLFSGRAHTTLMPLLKFSQHEMGMGMDMDMKVETPALTNDKQVAQSEDTVTFRGRILTIENKNVKVLLLKSYGFKGDKITAAVPVDEDQVSALQSVYEDILGVFFNDLERFRRMKSGPAVEAKREELVMLTGYIENEKLRLSMELNERAISQTDNVSDLAYMFDALLRDAKAICELPGSDEDDFFLEANANVLRLRSFRAYHMGLLYASLDKHAEALALLAQSEKLTERAIEEIAACDSMEKADTYLDDLEDLKSKIKGSRVGIKASVHLGLTNQVKGDLLSNLHKPAANYNLVELAMDCPPKPAFYDIAWRDFSEFSVDLEAFIQNSGCNQASSGRGGFLSGLFG